MSCSRSLGAVYTSISPPTTTTVCSPSARVDKDRSTAFLQLVTARGQDHLTPDGRGVDLGYPASHESNHARDDVPQRCRRSMPDWGWCPLRATPRIRR